MFVLTVDQRGSRRHSDAVPELLTALNGTYAEQLTLPFERTAGDEVQALTEAADTVVDLVTELVRRGGWSIGLGIGAVEHPLPDDVRAGRGAAFVAARAAVDRAKRQPSGVAVGGEREDAAERVETALWLFCGVLDRRSAAGWEAVEAMRTAQRQADAATSLGISAQAMSRRLRVAGWLEEERGRALVRWLLEGAA